MTDKERIDHALGVIRARAEAREAVRQHSAVRYERHPTSFVKQVEREGRSEWSGGNMGGGTWGGRSRGEREQP